MTGALNTDVLHAIDRLNSHARTGRGGGTMLAIYYYKQLFVMDATDRGEVKARAVQLIANCNRCDGTGLFVGWDWGPDAKPEPCRTCSKSGKVLLRFAETTIRDVVWHHPWVGGRHGTSGCTLHATAQGARTHWDGDYYLQFRDDSRAKISFENPGDWHPRRDGTELRGEDLAHNLNVAEAWVVDTSPAGYWRFWHELAVKAIPSYRLHLGMMREECFLCGSQENLAGHTLGSSSPIMCWSAHVCVECDNRTPRPWPTEPPGYALTPSVQAWLANPLRRDGLKKQEAA